MTPQHEKTLRKLRFWLTGFVIGLVLSGLTAFPLTWELEILGKILGAPRESRPEQFSGLTEWIVRVRNALRETDAKFPFIAYGTDWLAFAHLMIAVAFWGVWRDPVRNRFILAWGMFCCVATWPLAVICGPIHEIPFGWTVLDCAFGVAAIGPLYFCWKWAGELEAAFPPPSLYGPRLAGESSSTFSEEVSHEYQHQDS